MRGRACWGCWRGGRETLVFFAGEDARLRRWCRRGVHICHEQGSLKGMLCTIYKGVNDPQSLGSITVIWYVKECKFCQVVKILRVNENRLTPIFHSLTHGTESKVRYNCRFIPTCSLFLPCLMDLQFFTAKFCPVPFALCLVPFARLSRFNAPSIAYPLLLGNQDLLCTTTENTDTLSVNRIPLGRILMWTIDTTFEESYYYKCLSNAT